MVLKIYYDSQVYKYKVYNISVAYLILIYVKRMLYINTYVYQYIVRFIITSQREGSYGSEYCILPFLQTGQVGVPMWKSSIIRLRHSTQMLCPHSGMHMALTFVRASKQTGHFKSMIPPGGMWFLWQPSELFGQYTP